MRRRRLVVALVVGIPLTAAATLAVEVELARRSERLPDEGPLTYETGGSSTAVWIGDSTAVGIGVEDGADAVPSLVARARDERVVMVAESGATVRDVVGVQLFEVAAAKPDRIYVSVGANDVTHLTRAGDFRVDYRDLLARLPKGVPVTVLGIPDMGAPPRLAQPLRAIAGFRGGQLDEVVRSVADAQRPDDAVYVDIAGRTGRSFRDDPDRYFAGDRFHPSAAGYRLWADAVLGR